MEKKTAAAYIRVSTTDQTELSPDSQIKIVRKYADQHGYRLPYEYIFRDDGISGRRADKRPEFNAMIAASKQKPAPFCAVLLWKFSRFARNQEESIFYKSMLRRCGVEVISVSEPAVDGPFGTLIERIIEWSDEYYSIRLSGEVKRGMTEKAERGGAVSISSFGYDIIDKKYVPNDKADIVREIFSDYLSGMSLVHIARNLNLRGIRTNRGNMWESRTVEYVLRNVVYIGKIRWNPKRRTRLNYGDKDIIVSDGLHEPIVEREIFDEVQHKLDEQKNRSLKYRHEKSVRNEYMLRSLVKCSDCGGSLTMSVKGTGLQCCNYIHGKCGVSHYISLSIINKTIIEAVEKAFHNECFEIELNRTSEKRTDYDLIIQKETKKYGRIKKAYEEGIYSVEEYKTSRKVIDEKISKLKKQRDFSDKVIMPTEGKKEITAVLKSHDVSEREKNELLRSFIHKIVFDRAESAVRIFFA